MSIHFTYGELKHIMILTFQKSYVTNYRYKKHKFYLDCYTYRNGIMFKVPYGIGVEFNDDDYKTLFTLFIDDNYDVFLENSNNDPMHIHNQTKIRKYINSIINKKMVK